jgi:hypothetical protein
MKISDIKFSYFSTLNQYFPHIPYVASKKGASETNTFYISYVESKNLRRRCIELTQKTLGAKISAF